MEYYELDHDYEVGDIRISETSWGDLSDNHTIIEGKPITLDSPLVCTLANSTGTQTDYVCGTALPIVSDKFKLLLSEFSDVDYVQFLPVVMKGSKEIKQKYWLLNLLSNIKCFDWEKSQFKRTVTDNDGNDYPDSISSLVLKTDVIGERNIFRMSEVSVPKFISEKLKNEMEKNNFKGIEFSPLDEFMTF